MTKIIHECSCGWKDRAEQAESELVDVRAANERLTAQIHEVIGMAAADQVKREQAEAQRDEAWREAGAQHARAEAAKAENERWAAAQEPSAEEGEVRRG